MSLHRTTFPRQEELNAALRNHALDIDTPSQLSDAFRLGWRAMHNLGFINPTTAAEALVLIANIAEGSGTANSLPNIAKIARDALASSTQGAKSYAYVDRGAAVNLARHVVGENQAVTDRGAAILAEGVMAMDEVLRSATDAKIGACNFCLDIATETRKELDECKAALESARNGLQWYRDTYQEADSGADDEMMATIDECIPDRPTLAGLIHYPEHWDTAAYPTLHSAIHEVLANAGCSQCAAPVPATAYHCVEAIRFALTTDEVKPFLSAWMHGDWDVIRKEWPEAPESVFVVPESKECRHCGFLRAPNDNKSRPWYPLAEPAPVTAKATKEGKS